MAFLVDNFFDYGCSHSYDLNIIFDKSWHQVEKVIHMNVDQLTLDCETLDPYLEIIKKEMPEGVKNLSVVMRQNMKTKKFEIQYSWYEKKNE